MEEDKCFTIDFYVDGDIHESLGMSDIAYLAGNVFWSIAQAFLSLVRFAGDVTFGCCCSAALCFLHYVIWSYVLEF
jgi:hypothetical protein